MQRISFRKLIQGSRIGSFIARVKRYSLGLYRQLHSKARGFDDFFEFPFDISQPMPSSAKDVLAEIVGLLNKNNIEYWLADGTLLGIVRDRELIPHDTDLDFYLIDTINIEFIHASLSGMGFKVGRRMKYRGRVFQLTYFNADELLIDFLFWERNNHGNFQWLAPEINGRRSQESKFYDSYNVIKWQGLEIRTFQDHLDWLEKVYGKGWKIRETKKLDWTKSIGDLS